MDQIISTSDTIFEDYTQEHSDLLDFDQQNFEAEFNIVFKKSNLIKDDDADDIQINEKLYFVQNNISDLNSNVEKDVKIFSVSNNNKKFIFDPIPLDKNPSIISLEEEEEEFNSSPMDTLKTNNIWNENPEYQSTETKLQKSFSIPENLQSIEKKHNPFQVYKSTEFNVFHPGGKVELYKKLKDEIQGTDNSYQFKPSSFFKFKVKKKKKKIIRKKRREKISRKFKPDNIRKKIKSRFFKSIKTRINQILKCAKSKEFFDLLPQCFIINITKKRNQPIMKMTFQNLLEYDFIREEMKEEKHESQLVKKKRLVDIKKYNKNLKVMDYLGKNKDIVTRSKFDIIGNMTITQLFEEYLKSDEFEKEIAKLEKEGDNINYIKDYIVKAYGFINYFN